MTFVFFLQAVKYIANAQVLKLFLHLHERSLTYLLLSCLPNYWHVQYQSYILQITTLLFLLCHFSPLEFFSPSFPLCFSPLRPLLLFSLSLELFSSLDYLPPALQPLCKFCQFSPKYSFKVSPKLLLCPIWYSIKTSLLFCIYCYQLINKMLPLTVISMQILLIFSQKFIKIH